MKKPSGSKRPRDAQILASHTHSHLARTRHSSSPTKCRPRAPGETAAPGRSHDAHRWKARGYSRTGHELGKADAIAIDERLQRQGALIFTSGGDESLSDFHEQAGREKLKAES